MKISKFLTGYDIYNTIGNLIFGDKYKKIKIKTKYHDTAKSQYGKSLFDKINKKIRNPKLYRRIGPMVENICKKKHNIIIESRKVKK